MNVVDGSTYFERAVGNDHKMFKGGLSIMSQVLDLGVSD